MEIKTQCSLGMFPTRFHMIESFCQCSAALEASCRISGVSKAFSEVQEVLRCFASVQRHFKKCQ